MNRQDRRAVRKAMAPTHRDCGCTPRLLEPVEADPVCGCGHLTHFDPVPLPTAAPVGSLKTVEASCSACGGDLVLTCLVGVL